MTNDLCKYCFKKLINGKCSCSGDEGNDIIQGSLPLGTRLNNRYIIGRVIGQGGFGIAYLGCDEENSNKRVAIKEYFPKDIAGRSAKTRIDVLCTNDNEREHFDSGLARCLREANILAEFGDNESVLSVENCFNENGTVYLVTRYVEGETLEKFVKKNGPFSYNEIYRLMEPVMKSLVKIHVHGVTHRDISPDNLILCDGKLILIDFGSAKDRTYNQNSSQFVKKGYSPYEFYFNEEILPSSDVYSLCATIYYCITGTVPLDALTRVYKNQSLVLPSKILGNNVELPASVEKALLKGMNLVPLRRYQTVTDMMRGLVGGDEEEKSPVVFSDKDSVTEEQHVNRLSPVNDKKWDGIRYLLIAFFVCVLLIGGGIAIGRVVSKERSIESGNFEEPANGEESNFVDEQIEHESYEKEEIIEEPIIEKPEAVEISINHCYMGLDGETYDIAEVESISVTSGDKVEVDSFIKDKEGFLFLGALEEKPSEYFAAGSFVSEIFAGEGNTNELTLYYKRNKYSLFVETTLGYAEVQGSGKYYYGENVKVECIPAMGYVFTGWEGYSELSGSAEVIEVSMPAEDLFLEARVEANTYTLSFDSCGGATLPNMKVVFGEEYDLPDGPDREGYVFEGWYTEKDAGKKIDTGDKVNIQSDTVLYAHWAAGTGISYRINHYLESISESGYELYKSEEKSGKTGGNIVISSISDAYDGFKFVGASVGTKGSSTPGKFVTNTTILSDGTRVINAYYDREEYTITFDANGGDLSNTSKVIKAGGMLGDLPVPVRTYYSFEGWYNQKSGGNRVTASSIVEGNMKIFARWVIKKESDWVLASEVPKEAMITSTKWIYTLTETKESTNIAESGWEKTDSYWREKDKGSIRYASFPEGFDSSNILYVNYAKEPYLAYEESTKKREVNNEWTSFIYWHWMYNVQYAPVTNRAISHRSGSWDEWGNAGSGLNYKYFYAFESAVDCPYLDNRYCCSQNIPSYNCGSVLPDKSSLGTGCDRFFRFDVYTSYYTDYEKVFQYQRITSGVESVSEVKDGGTISDVVKYVKYREK